MFVLLRDSSQVLEKIDLEGKRLISQRGTERIYNYKLSKVITPRVVQEPIRLPSSFG